MTTGGDGGGGGGDATAAQLLLDELLVAPRDGTRGVCGRGRAGLGGVEGAAEELHRSVVVAKAEGEEVGVGVEHCHVGRIDVEEVLEGVVRLRVVPARVEGDGAVQQGCALLLQVAPLPLERRVGRVEAAPCSRAQP